MTKTCSLCKLEKDKTNFYRRSQRTSKVTSRCKDCCKLVREGRTEEEKNAFRERRKAWRRQNPEMQRKHNRNYYLKNRESRIKAQKEIYLNNRRYYIEYNNAWQSKARKERPSYRIGKNLRARIARELKATNSGNIVGKNRYIGCSYEELKVHIEEMFVGGMSWENYGTHGWHIDHIRPISSFNLENESERHAAFHYSNMQPLWAKDNLSKGNKYDNKLNLQGRV
jgi:hypothetical protein